jgi:anti-sigma factor RsiW
MNLHQKAQELLPLYVSAGLDEDQRRMVARHLEACAECRADLGLWEVAADEVSQSSRVMEAPPQVIERALESIHALRSNRRSPLLRGRQLLLAQVPLVRRDIWPASAGVMAIGFVCAILLKSEAAIQLVAPLLAAACIAVVYGRENDPAVELALSTPTSPWQILLARLALVFGYNLILALAASLALLPVLPGSLLGNLILGWLGPMTFLSAVALAFSLWLSNDGAIAVTYLAWIGSWVAGSLLNDPKGPFDPAPFLPLLSLYHQLWSSPNLLLILSVPVLLLALWSVKNQERSLPRLA